ncbi:hypothetical protein FB451DRAFT_1170479 [Mycena latifolia]|nr:hypothetical protein FB451DRAFT_1170479 [Mycena latifolia]
MAQIDVEIGALRDGVERNIKAAKQLFGSLQYSMGTVFCDIITAALHVNEGELLKANSLFEACLRSAWVQYTEAVSYCLERLGNVSLWLDIAYASYNWAVTFLVHSLKLKQKLEIHKALQLLGDLYLTDGDQQTGISGFTVALEGFTKMDVHHSRAECMLRLGDISELHGDLHKAVELWKTARPVFERTSQVKQVDHIDKRLAGVSNMSEDHPKPMVQLLALNAPKSHLDTVIVEEEDETRPSLIPA